MTYHGERVTQGATVKRSSVFWLMMGGPSCSRRPVVKPIPTPDVGS